MFEFVIFKRSNLLTLTVELLDCTLRDGGYINNWKFSKESITKIILALNNTKIENIECGYLADKSFVNSTIFSTIKDFDSFFESLEIENQANLFLMADYGKYDFSKLTPSKYVSGIRLAFHKKDVTNIFEDIKKIIDVNLKVSIQPMITNNYSKKDLQKLVAKLCEYKIASFYIVDSFGSMFYEDVTELFNFLDELLPKNIKIGFHSHNNMGSSFSVSKHFIELVKNRDIVIDSTINGIGRGGGNLSTEFISYYLKKLNHYEVENLFDSDFFENKEDFKTKLFYFISAINKIHPSKVELLKNQFTTPLDIIRNLEKN